MSLITGASSLSLAAFGLLIAGSDISISISIHIWFIASAAFPWAICYFNSFLLFAAIFIWAIFNLSSFVSFRLHWYLLSLNWPRTLAYIAPTLPPCVVVLLFSASAGELITWVWPLDWVRYWACRFGRSPLLTLRGPFILSCWFTALYLLSFTWPRTLDFGISILRFIFGYFWQLLQVS